MLKQEILERYPIDILIELHNEYPSIRIDKEIARRLSDLNTYEEVLPFIDYIEKTSIIIESLNTLKYKLPWRIAVIYNYLTGQVKTVEISIGYTGRYYISTNNLTTNRENGKPILFTWLDCFNHKLMLREVKNGEKNRFSIYNTDPEIINLLLSSETLNLVVGMYHISKPTFPQPLGENYEDFPILIYNAEKEIKLTPFDIPSYNLHNIHVQKSISVLKLIQVFKVFVS